MGHLQDLEEVRALAERTRQLRDELGLTLEEFVALQQFQTVHELQDVEDALQGTARGGVTRGGGLPPVPGTIKRAAVVKQVQAGEDMFDDDIEVDANVAILRAAVAIDSGGTARVFSANVKDGTDNAVIDFNSGNTIGAGTAQAFDLPVTSDITANYQLGGQETLAYILVQEIDTAGP